MLGLERGKKIKVEPLLDFCVPSDNPENWEQTSMLHYSLMPKEAIEPEFFRKSTFLNGLDMDWKSDRVSKANCGIKYVEYIDRVINQQK